MSWKIDRGLFKYDFIDYHAILCVSVDADVKDIRKRYLKIARRLHPDSNPTASAAEKQLATELLSKWVNPAYEKLSAERTRGEYMVVLSQMGKRLVQESSSVELNTDLARQLASVPNVEHVYKSAIAKIAETEYDSLEKVLQIVAHVSELNLVYLMRTAGKSFASASQQAPVSPINTGVATPNKATKTPPAARPAPPKEDSVAIQYLRRAQELLGKNQLAQARVELQDAIKLEPNNSRCHSLIGVVYLKQNQSTMAKVHFDRALQLDPNDETALKGKRVLEQALGQKTGGSKVTSSSNNGGKQSDKSGNGGLFGGLFGGKKK
jgi:curved DNA-binding protein CbpA